MILFSKEPIEAPARVWTSFIFGTYIYGYGLGVLVTWIVMK